MDNSVAGQPAGPSSQSYGMHESVKLTTRQKSASSSKSSINSENLYTKNLTFGQLFKRSILKNVLLVSTIGAVFTGVVVGMSMRYASSTGRYSSDTVSLLAFPGDMFLRMLKMLILPLIIASVISALASLDSTVSGKIGMRACMFYMTTTVVATITGIILVTLIHPGNKSMKEGMINKHHNSHQRHKGSTVDAITDLVRQIIPDNIVAACFQHPEMQYTVDPMTNATLKKIVNKEGANVLGLMFFCCLFGVICSKLGERASILVKFFQALDHTVMQMVLLAMYFSPIGIASLIIEKLLTIDDLGDTMSRLGMYMVTVIVGLILHGFISIPSMYGIATRKNPLTFMRKCTECIVFAIGTGSSTATLPVTFKCLEENVKCDTRITRFVLPIGATINMDGTALYEAVAAIFIGQMNGMVFSFSDLIIISLTSTAASFGAAAVPSAGLVTMIMVLTAVGLPTEDITMIVAVDWFLDRIRTAVNVLSDGYVAGIVAHLSKDELDKYDAEQGAKHPELDRPHPLDSQGSEYESIKERIKSGNSFKLFQIEEKLKIDEKKLKHEMHKLQRVFHPDKIMSRGREPTDFTNSFSTIVNQAYQTLKDPYKRAKYLLEVKLDKSPGAIELSLERLQLDPDFLNRMMDTQEQINRESGMALVKLKCQIDAELDQLTNEIDRYFEEENYELVLKSLGKLQFLSRCQSTLRRKVGDDF